MVRLHPSLRLAEERYEARAQHFFPAEAHLYQHLPIRRRLFQRIFHPGDEMLRTVITTRRCWLDLAQPPQPRVARRGLRHHPPCPAAPVKGWPALAPCEHTVQARRPLLVEVEVGLGQRGDRRWDRDLGERIERRILASLHTRWSPYSVVSLLGGLPPRYCRARSPPRAAAERRQSGGRAAAERRQSGGRAAAEQRAPQAAREGSPRRTRTSASVP